MESNTNKNNINFILNNFNIPLYRTAKNTKGREMIPDINGEWINKSDIEQLLLNVNSYKEEWTFENAMNHLTKIIDNMNIDSAIKLQLQILSSSMIGCMITLSKNKND